MVTAPNPLMKGKIPKQAAKVTEANIRVGPTPENTE
jgi:hypothetical protein